MARITQDEFENAICDALDLIPDALVEAFENVVVIAEDEPQDWQLERTENVSSELLGFYDGISLIERGESYGAVDDCPDTITIFKGPHERLGLGKDATLEEVRKTVIHEVGHYFGMDEEQVARMGYA